MSQKVARAALLVAVFIATVFVFVLFLCSLMKDLDLHYQVTQDNPLSQSISRK